MIGSPVVELPMVVDEIQDVEAGKPDEAVEKEMPVGPVFKKVIAHCSMPTMIDTKCHIIV